MSYKVNTESINRNTIKSNHDIASHSMRSAQLWQRLTTYKLEQGNAKKSQTITKGDWKVLSWALLRTCLSLYHVDYSWGRQPTSQCYSLLKISFFLNFLAEIPCLIKLSTLFACHISRLIGRFNSFFFCLIANQSFRLVILFPKRSKIKTK